MLIAQWVYIIYGYCHIIVLQLATYKAKLLRLITKRKHFSQFGMRKGILRDFVILRVEGLGELAIEDSRSHKLDIVTCRPGRVLKALTRHKGKEIYWDLDKFGVLASFEPVEDPGK